MSGLIYPHKNTCMLLNKLTINKKKKEPRTVVVELPVFPYKRRGPSRPETWGSVEAGLYDQDTRSNWRKS